MSLTARETRSADHDPSQGPLDPVSCTFYEMLTRLHQDAYTGQVVLHLHQGKPTVAEIPGPAEQIRLR